MKRVHIQQPGFRFLFFLLLLGLSLIALPSGTAAAQEPTPSDDDVNAIARKMYCPVCENTPLDVCPTQACEQWREEIRLRLALGWTNEEIFKYFEEQYGARVLAEPPRTGLNWLVYIVPPVAFGLGVYILYRAFRSWRSLAKESPEVSSPPSLEQDEYVSRMEEELRKRG